MSTSSSPRYHTLRCATLNVGRSGHMKRQEIFSLASLQEVDLHVISAPAFVKFWKAHHFQVRLAEPVNGIHRVALLSKVALKTVQLDIGDKHRCVATAIATDQPILLASCYGFSDDPPRARAFAKEVTEALHVFGRPWIALGDWNLEETGLSSLFAEGLATSLDEPFQVGTPLPPTRHPGSRRIDFGLAHRIHATEVFHREGVADHKLVGYSVEAGLALQGHFAPKRLVLSRLGEAPEAELHTRWTRLWQAHSFAQALDEGDVDLAWSLLSDTAEGVLSGTDSRDPAGCTLRSQRWEPRRAHAGHRDMASPETVALRRLCRLLRRALHYQRSPSVDLLRHLRRGVTKLQSEFGELKDAPDVTAAAFCDLLHNLVERRASSEQQQCLHTWRARMRGSEKERRRWVKARTQDFKEYCRHHTETIKPGVSFRSLHPARVLQQAEDEWTQVWTAGEVHPDRIPSATPAS